jgi:adenosylcobinamide-GDP ribazoletransferase
VLALLATAPVAIAAAWLGPLPWLAALLGMPVAAAAVALVLARVARRRFDGSTGDVLGATVELATLAALLVLALAG